MTASALSTTELTELRNSHERTMRDVLVIGTPAAQSGSEPTKGDYTYSTTEIACGVNTNISNEVTDGTKATVTDGTIRVPWATSISSANRVKVTKRDAVALATPEVYAILGTPKRARAELILNVLRVVGDSER